MKAEYNVWLCINTLYMCRDSRLLHLHPHALLKNDCICAFAYTLSMESPHIIVFDIICHHNSL